MKTQTELRLNTLIVLLSGAAMISIRILFEDDYYFSTPVLWFSSVIFGVIGLSAFLRVYNIVKEDKP